MRGLQDDGPPIMESSGGGDSEPLHWTWACKNNAILVASFGGGSRAPELISRSKAISCWGKFLPLLKTIEGLPVSASSVHCELLARHNAAAVLLMLESQCSSSSSSSANEDAGACMPLNAGSHVAFRLLRHGLLRAVSLVRKPPIDGDCQRYSSSLSLETGDAVEEDEARDACAMCKEIVAAVALAAESASEETVRLLSSLLVYLSALGFALQQRMFEQHSREMYGMCVSVMALLRARSPTKCKDEPDICLLGFAAAVKSFWQFSDLKQQLANVICVSLFIGRDDDARLESLRANREKSFGDGEHATPILRLVEAWWMCSRGDVLQCSALLDAGDDDSAAPELDGDVYCVQANLLHGVCHALTAKPQHALDCFKVCVAQNALPTSLSAMFAACQVFQHLNKPKSEIEAWKLSVELYREFSANHSVCCAMSGVQPSFLLPDGSMASEEKVSLSAHVLPALTVHRQLHAIAVHLSTPPRLQLLRGHARALLSQHGAADDEGECAAAYSTLVRAVTEGSSCFAKQVFDGSEASYSILLLEHAEALRNASRPEDSVPVCTQLLGFCFEQPGSRSSELGVAISGDKLLTTGRARGASTAGCSPASQKRKHDDNVDLTGSGLSSRQQLSVLFLEAAAWLCRALSLRSMQQYDDAEESLRRCIETLEDLPSPSSRDAALKNATAEQLSQLYTLKGRALYTLADLLHITHTATGSDHTATIRDCLQGAIACCNSSISSY